MGNNPATAPEALLQLVIRAHRTDPLIRSEQDWRALGAIASRMLFWCGGAIYGCRCEGSEMRLALQVLRAPIGTIAHQIAGAYAMHLRRTRKIAGSVFEHYRIIPLEDDTFLDDLVFWLHRSRERTIVSTALWTAESAYLFPNSLPWIETDRVWRALSVGAPGPAAYRRHKLEGIPAHAIELFTRRPARPSRGHGRAMSTSRPNIEHIARIVAEFCRISYGDMLADTRRRAVSQARVIATVLATRNGASVAAVARHFNRSRSTLIEQVEHYRASQPEIFGRAESVLQAAIRGLLE
jgi:hypothetical protein